MTTLLADVGGTHTRCAISAAGRITQQREYLNADWNGVEPLLRHYLDRLPERPRRALLAVAAPLQDDHVDMINIDWQFSRRALREALGLQTLDVLNDFEALAYALPVLDDGQLLQIGPGRPRPGAAKAVIGPGTGLGVGVLAPLGDDWQALASEGGHVTLPACNDTEADLIRRARDELGHCSAERLVSGPGLSLLHQLLHGGPRLPAERLGELIEAGDAAARTSLETLFLFLGTVASDLALTVGAWGGIYIGGGIVPRYRELFAASGFRARFIDKGRYQRLLENTPTWLIVAHNPALLGLHQRATRQD